MEERLYDLIFIARPATPEDEIKKIISGIEHTCAEKGAKIEKTEHWGTRKLAYRVAKHREGIYVYQQIRCSNSELVHELSSEGGVATLRMRIPFTEKAEIDLKKVGDELIVSVGGEKRTIILPSALAEHSPSGASFEAGTLKVTFDDVRSPRPQPERV